MACTACPFGCRRRKGATDLAKKVTREIEVKQYKLERLEPAWKVTKAKPGSVTWAGIETQWRLQRFIGNADADRRLKRKRQEQFAQADAELAQLAAENPPACMCGDGNPFSHTICAIHRDGGLTLEQFAGRWMVWRNDDIARRCKT